MANPLDALRPFACWKLDKLSGATFDQDILGKLRKDGHYSDADLEEVAKLLAPRQGAYRCRIGKSRFYFADQAETAINAAVAAEMVKRKRK